MLNKQKGNMYGFVTHTWNPIKGKCSHDCSYCYMKIWKQKPIRLVEKELNDDLGTGNFIFVGSSTDMFADDVPSEWIIKVLEHCKNYNKNTYLFQSKNPKRMKKLYEYFPIKTVFCTTIETNRLCFNNKVPDVDERCEWMRKFCKDANMITIEPIMDFDLEPFVKMIKQTKTRWVSIGADSKRHGLEEPSSEKVEELIKELEKFTEVRIKDNLKRLRRNDKNGSKRRSKKKINK